MSPKEETIKAILREIAQKDLEIRPDDSLVDDFGFNSLQLIQLTGLIEDEFDILVPMDKVLHIKTVKDIYSAMDEAAELFPAQ